MLLQKVSRVLAIKKGFTLIELLIVIAIVGILASAILPRFTAFNTPNFLIDNIL